MEVKLCTDCNRPMWQGYCLYERGFLAGIEEGRKMQIQAEKDHLENKKPKIKYKNCKFKNCQNKFGGSGGKLPKFCPDHNEFNNWLPKK